MSKKAISCPKCKSTDSTRLAEHNDRGGVRICNGCGAVYRWAKVKQC